MSVPPRLVPLLAQLDTSLAMALERMQGLTDEVVPPHHGLPTPR